MQVDSSVDHRLFTEEGHKQIKNDAVDTAEFGQDIGRAVGTVKKEAALGATDFWRTLDNNTKATQLKNELTRNPEYALLLEGLKSPNGDVFAKSFTGLGQMAQAKFGNSPDQFSEIFLYSGSTTSSSSLGSNLYADTKGGTVLDLNNSEYGNIFVNAGGGVKTDLLNTLGHETVEAFTLKTGGKNDATQEAQSNAFGAQFSDRINQAAGSSLDSTGGSSFNSSLQTSTAVTFGTQKANNVGTAAVDNRKLNSQFAMGLPNYIASKKSHGDLQGAQVAEVLLILGKLAATPGPTDNLNAEIDQLDATALGVSPESLATAKALPDAIKKRIAAAEPSDFCKGTACRVSAEAVDGMVNLESMTDLAVEYVGGKLIEIGVDAYIAVKAGRKAINEVNMPKSKGSNDIDKSPGVEDAEAGGYSQYDKYKKQPGPKVDSDWNRPDNKGFLGKPTESILPVGTRIDRFGKPIGSFVSPEGISYEARALAPGTKAEKYHVYEVKKPLPVLMGEIAPAFDEIGGGVQILPNLPQRVNIEWLIKNEYLVEVN